MLTKSGNKRKARNYTERLTTCGDRWADLANAIVAQAAMDYKGIIRREARGEDISDGVIFDYNGTRYESNINHVTYQRLEDFFRSEWCEALLSHTQISGDWLLRQLKKKRAKTLGIPYTTL